MMTWVVLFLLLIVLPTQTTRAEETETSQSSLTALEQHWGIRLVCLRLTGAGHFLDFRYRVMDPEKAKPLLKRNNETYLLDQASGRKLPVPVTKLGPMRSTTVAPQPHRDYSMLFANINRVIKDGSLVTVVIGDFKAENLRVNAPFHDAPVLSEQKQQEWDRQKTALQEAYRNCLTKCVGNRDCAMGCEKEYRTARDQSYEKLLQSN